MRVAQIYETGLAQLGASVASVVLNLSKHLSKLGCDVTVIERGSASGSNPYLESTEVKEVRVSVKELASIPYKEVRNPIGLCRLILDRSILAFKLNKVLKTRYFDVVHVHFPFASSILVNLNKKLRDKIVYTAHIGEERKRFALDSSALLALKLFSPDLYLMKRVRKSVVLNEPLKEKLVKKGIPEEKLEVIPNGVNVEDFNVNEEEIERIRKKYGLEGITVMFAGTVTPRKGVLQLIRAGEILKLDREVLFLIVGNLNIDREYAQKVMGYAKSRGVNAKFTNFVPYDDLKALYSACDIFVLPSFEEGQPLVLLEAMASGKPLIGSYVGGIPMQIREGWNGFLVKPGDKRQLAEKIKYLIENEEERNRMGRNSRKLAEEEFNWKKISEKYLEVYREVSTRNYNRT
jgi:glycosyltransferase involved in cell wall biosynthesis